jgi:hypothetical protein
VTLPGDVTLLEQAVSNLVYNAVRYNRAGGHVAVTLDLTAGGFELRVIDDGPGLSDDDLGRLVERGFRGDAARGRSTGGHGLGLHITHTVARLHGFALAFDNRAEGGLEVTLMGPALPPALGGCPYLALTSTWSSSWSWTLTATATWRWSPPLTQLSDHLREHCNDTFEQLGATLVALLGDELAQLMTSSEAAHSMASPRAIL